jgi:hypothetical protein
MRAMLRLLIAALVVVLSAAATPSVGVVYGECGRSGYTDGTTFAARFKLPYFGAVDSANANLIVADLLGQRVRNIALSSGHVTTAAGSGVIGYQNASALLAKFNNPSSVAIVGGGSNTATGTVFISDNLNHVVRRLYSREVSTLAGSGTAGFANGGYTAAEFDQPFSVAWYDGAVFVADTRNNQVRCVNASNAQVSSWAGGIAAGFADGVPGALNNPMGLAVAADGTLFVSDTLNRAVRKITHPAKVLSTIAGSPLVPAGNTDGSGSGARFSFPMGVALWRDGAGASHLFVADWENSNVRAVSGAGPTRTVVAGAGLEGIRGVAVGGGTLFAIVSGLSCVKRFSAVKLLATRTRTVPHSASLLVSGTLSLTSSGSVSTHDSASASAIPTLTPSASATGLGSASASANTPSATRVSTVSRSLNGSISTRPTSSMVPSKTHSSSPSTVPLDDERTRTTPIVDSPADGVNGAVIPTTELEAVSASSLAIGVIGAVVVNPASALQVSRALAIVVVAGCAASADRPLVFPLSVVPPFGFGSAAQGRYWRGATVANAAAVVAVAIGMLVIGAIVAAVKRQRSSDVTAPLPTAMRVSRFPGALAIPFAVVSGGSSLTAVALAWHSFAGAGEDGSIATAGAAFVVAGIVASVWCVRRSLAPASGLAFVAAGLQRRNVAACDALVFRDPAAAAARATRLLMFGDRCWANAEHEQLPGNEAKDLFGVLFTRYHAPAADGGRWALRGVAPYYLAVEIAVTVLVSGLSGLVPSSCVAVCAAMLAVNGAGFVLLLAVRPYIVPARNVLALLGDFFACAACAVALAALRESDDVRRRDLAATAARGALNSTFFVALGIGLSVLRVVVCRVFDCRMRPLPTVGRAVFAPLQGVGDDVGVDMASMHPDALDLLGSGAPQPKPKRYEPPTERAVTTAPAVEFSDDDIEMSML